MYVLGLGLEDKIISVCKELFPELEIRNLLDAKILEYFEATQQGEQPKGIFCGKNLAGTPPLEIAQLVRYQFPNQPVFYTLTERTVENRNDLLKNGFSEVFLIPLDSPYFKEQVEEKVIVSPHRKVYREVSFIDLKASTQLDFGVNVFLPMNKKYVPLVREGETLSEEKVKKMAEREIRSVFVSTQEIEKFYEYTAGQLAAMTGDAAISETEKKQKLSQAVRSLLRDVIGTQSNETTFEQGKELLTNCQNVVKQYILKSSSASWYSKISSALSSDTDQFNHAGRVSTLAALISMGVSIGKPEELALAGLLHDSGIALMPAEFHNKLETEMSPQELEEYKKHPEMAVSLAKQRKIVLSESLQKIILQHHERFDGTGYPNKVIGKKLMPEAQVLAIADELDLLCIPKPGQLRLTPAAAMKQIRQRQIDNAGNQKFSPEIIEAVFKLFSAQE